MNRLCLAADVPLVESGTAGYLGQVQVIKKVLCFDAAVRMLMNIRNVFFVHSFPIVIS